MSIPSPHPIWFGLFLILSLITWKCVSSLSFLFWKFGFFSRLNPHPLSLTMGYTCECSSFLSLIWLIIIGWPIRLCFLPTSAYVDQLVKILLELQGVQTRSYIGLRNEWSMICRRDTIISISMRHFKLNKAMIVGFKVNTIIPYFGCLCL